MIDSKLVEGGYTDYDLELANWRGQTVRALVDMNEELKEIKESIKSCYDKMDKTNEKIDRVDEKMTSLKIRVAEIGAASGLLTSVIFLLLSKFL